MALEKLTERGVRLARMRASVALLYSIVYEEMQTKKRPPRQPVRHLWWPRDDMAIYELRDGNPPADVDRPAHLKGYRLEIDLGLVPRDVREEIKRTLLQAQSSAETPLDLTKMVGGYGFVNSLRRVKGPGPLS